MKAAWLCLGISTPSGLGHNPPATSPREPSEGLKALRPELDHNDISGTIEDTNGAFSGLDSLNKLTLFGNKIKSVAKKAFSGLETLEHLNLGENAIRSIQPDAFSKMKNLKTLFIQSDSFLSDCQLHWLPDWLVTRGLQAGVNATCAHPESLRGTSIFQAPSSSFVCDDLQSPRSRCSRETTVTILVATYASPRVASAAAPPSETFAWHDQELLRHAETENHAHVRSPPPPRHDIRCPAKGREAHGVHHHIAPEAPPSHMRAATSASSPTTLAPLTPAKARHHNVLPSFVKTPKDSTIRTGHTARLEARQQGHPRPQIAWAEGRAA
ncbi:leucine-rich repeats and immunoglobulin-like domains protein 1 isoform X1 [Lates japonicus]|nr:leucine-rich repeats and immunoglobulin-like domains protein 1 isoform X1 [Lates japonicus]